MVHSQRRLATFLSAGLVCAALAASFNNTAYGANIRLPNVYHGQVTNYFCGAASMEMMLDTPTTTTTNQAVVTLLAGGGNGDNGYVPQNPFPRAPNAGAQAAIYSLVHGGTYGAGTVYAGNSVYNNPAFGPGTDPFGFANGMNAIDNATNANNAAVSALTGSPGPTNTHGYAYYNFSPAAYFSTYGNALYAGYAASNTIAASIRDWIVPASASVNYGGHWIDVNGYTTATNNANIITGFWVRDPWTGYAKSQNLPNRGLGTNTWLRYGYDVNQFSQLVPRGWFQSFTPASNGANAGAGVGYSIIVEPQGPESLDTPTDFGFSTMNEGSLLSASQAASAAASDLATDPNLSPNFSGDTEDTSNSDSDLMLKSLPGDTGSEGDWLVPYDGPGGTNDVAGFALIDAETGAIDQATWFDASTGDMTLSQLDDMFAAQAQGLADPSDNAVPEPSSLALLGIGAVGAAAVVARRRKTAV